MAVDGKSTITDRGGYLTGGGTARVEIVYTGEGENADCNGRTPLEDLLPISSLVTEVPIERTKIQHHPNLPAVPLMKEIP